MNKLKNTLIAAIAIATISLTSAYAGMSIGVVGSVMDAKASGTETDRLTAGGANVADTSTRTKSVSDNNLVGSIYAEYTMSESSWPLSIGVEITPGTADISGKLSRTDTETSVTGNQFLGATSVKRSAEASVTDMATAYIEAPLFGGLYAKVGIASLTVNHANDSGMDNSSSLTGTNLGIGWKTTSASGYHIKASYEETDYDSINLRSTGNSVAANSTGVTADVDTEAFRISIGKDF